MIKAIVMPDLENSVSEVEIGRWFVKKGEEIKAGEPLVEVLIEKANVTIDAEVSGRVVDIKYEEGFIVQIGEEIASIEVAE